LSLDVFLISVGSKMVAGLLVWMILIRTYLKIV
jgi:hypothetical protein